MYTHVHLQHIQLQQISITKQPFYAYPHLAWGHQPLYGESNDIKILRVHLISTFREAFNFDLGKQ